LMRTIEPSGQQIALATAPQVVIDGPEFDPTLYLETQVVENIRRLAVQHVRAPHFNHQFLMKLIQDFGAGDTPDTDSMLKSLRMQDYGQLADTLQATTRRMRRVTKDIPTLDPKWIQQVAEGRLLFKSIAGYVRDFAEEIAEAIDLWTSFLDEFEEADQELLGHQNRMQEHREANDAIATQEFVRTMRLIQLCATLSLFRQEIGKRLEEISTGLSAGPNEALTDEQRRLESVAPILVYTLGSLIPLIPTTENNGIMFTNQRNDNALQEFRLFLFRTLGIAQWKANTLVQLNAASSRAAGLALSIAQKAMNEEGNKASQAYKDEMAQVASDLKDFMLELDTFQNQVNAIVEGSEILTEGLEAADRKARNVSRTIAAGREKVESAHERWNEQLQGIMSTPPATQ